MSKEFTGNHETDASVWAKELCKQHPEIDEDRLIGWFANSIMAGHDVATSKCTDEIDQLKAEKSDLLEALEELASVIDESEGVAGWHLNGAVARWDEFDCVQKIEVAIKKARGEE